MHIYDKRMLKLKEFLKANGTIRFDKEFCDAIGILKQNLYQIENPEKVKRMQHFTTQHIENAGKVYGVDMNYIFGFAPYPFKDGKKPAEPSSTLESTLTPKKEQKEPM